MSMAFTFDPPQLTAGQPGTMRVHLEERSGKFHFVFRQKDGAENEKVFDDGTQAQKTIDLKQGDWHGEPVLFAEPGNYVVRFKRATSNNWQEGTVVGVLPAPFPLIAGFEPDPALQKDSSILTVKLAPNEAEGTYRLFFDPLTDAFVGSATPSEEYVEMRSGEDREVEVIFPYSGDFTLKVSFGIRPYQPGPRITVLPAASPAAEKTVALAATPRPITADEILWRFIDAITSKLRFDEFREFVMAEYGGNSTVTRALPGQGLIPPFFEVWQGTIAYDTLRDLADEFVNVAASPKHYPSIELPPPLVDGAFARSYVSDEGRDLAAPYLDQADQSGGDFTFPLPNIPFVELIWNYWIEEGMLVQSLYHILAKFQNRRPGPGRDPLERFDLNPLLPLRQLLWGFAEDERRRLTVRRRAAEYEYEYGLQLRGRAIPSPAILAERRSAFLEAFHSLLYETHRFYKERDDKTVDADAFPLLSGLRELHLVLAYGAHNQFANLALQARSEMLIMQWLLAQPEMREFLGGRTMVPYEEPWMDRVDAMKSIQGWTDTSITHFFDLAFHGERILLSVRHGRWNESGRDRDDASSWALRGRNSVQRYIHAYRAVTGVDLSSSVNGSRPPNLATMPSDLLALRVGAQARRRA